MTDNVIACKVAKPDIAMRLRRETRDAHCQIEAVMSDLLFTTPIDLQAYKHMLSRHRDYYAQIEASLSEFNSTAVMIRERSKISWLNSDIDYLEDGSEQHRKEQPLDYALTTKLPVNEAQAWGFLYVFEGATLGGAHILDKLRHEPCFDAEQGLRFFHSYGRKTPAMWRAFQSALQQFVASTPGSEEQVIQGANQSFSNMNDLMKGVQVD